MNDWECKDLNTFIDECHRSGVHTVIIAQQKEYGQHPDPSAVRYERLDLITCLAYAGGRILRLRLEGSDPEAGLVAAGFTVERRSRNLI